MFKTATILFLYIMAITTSKAQNFAGTYRLHGLHDAAGAFNFTADGHFSFGFIYGASDRFAEGTYTLVNDTVKLQSNKKPGADFTVTLQQKKESNYTIKIQAPNKQLFYGVSCIYYMGNYSYEATPDAEGIIELPAEKIDTIYLQHLYFPDIPTLIKDVNNANTYFEVSMNKSLMEVSFKGIDLFIKDNTLTWLPNYLIPAEGIYFLKEE